MSVPAPEKPVNRGREHQGLSGREADLLRELAETINASLDIDAVLQRVTAAARELCRSDVARIALREAGSDSFAFRSSVGARAQASADLRLTVGRGLAGQVLATGQAVRNADVLNESAATSPRLVQAEEIRSVLIVPIRIRDRVEGLIEVANHAVRPFGERDEAMLRRLAEHAAVAIRNSQLFAAEQAAGAEVAAFAERLRALADNAPIGLFRITPRGRILAANQALVDMLGYPDRTTLVARATANAHVDADDRAAWRSLMERDGLARGLEVQVRRYDGGVIWARSTARAVHDEHGLVIAYEGSLEDITERKAAERERLELLEREGAARAEAEVAQGHLSFLAEVSTLLAGSLDYEATLQILARLAVPALADMCVIDMLADDGTIRRVAAAHVNPELAALVATVQQRFPPDPDGPHPVASVLRTGRPEMVWEITEPVLAVIAPDPEHRQIARALAYTSYIVVPLVARDRTLGALSLVSGQSGRHYAEADLALAEELARRAALAVDNARLYTESEQRRRIAEVLTATGRLLSQTLSLEDVAQRVVGSVRELIGVACVIVYRVAPDTGHYVPLAVSGNRGLPERFPMPAGMGLVGLALRERRTAISGDFTNDPRVVLDEDVRARLLQAPRAGLAVPLVVQDQTIGALFLGDRLGRRFTDDEVRLAEAFADQAALAFNNARLYAAQEIRAERLRILAHVNRLVSSSLEIDEVLEGISRMAAEIMSIPVVTLWIVDAAAGTATLRACSSERHRRDYPIGSLPLAGNLIGAIALERRAIHVADALADDRIPVPEWYRTHGLRSVYGFPIVWRQTVLGVLALHSPQPFLLTSDDENLVQMFAAQAAVALRNAQLYQEAQHRQREAEAVALQAERARSEAEAATVELRRLQGITDVALATLGVEDLLGELLTRVLDVLGVDTAAVFLVDQERQVLVLRAASGLEAGHSRQPIPVGQGFSGRVVLARGPIVAEDIDQVEMHESLLKERGIRSLLGAPLVVGGWATGIIRVGSTQARRFSDDDARLLQLVADRVALAIENAHLYEAERSARSEAEAANRAKDHFLAMLAHELRNPLAPIRSGFYLIGQRLGDDPMVQRARQIIERQLAHLTRLLDDLLDVARITQGKIELLKVPVDLGAAVTEAMEATRGLIESRGHSVRLELPATPIRLEADPTRLVQIIGNLLNNAAKYTPPRGSITLAAHQDADWVTLSVKDTGIGIPGEMLPRIFDLFAQVDPSPARSEGGLGIGLTLVRRLVELHSGEVSARSEGKGRGSEFIVRLPAGPVVTKASHAGTAATGGSARSVLVVEDNPDNAHMLQACLELAGHRVMVTGNGADAVALAVRQRPDVMLVDIGLPGFDGYEVARRVRTALGSAVLLVALTGYGQPQDRRQALEAGFDSHLVKPVDPDELTTLIAQAAR